MNASGGIEQLAVKGASLDGSCACKTFKLSCEENISIYCEQIRTLAILGFRSLLDDEIACLVNVSLQKMCI